MTLEEMMRIAEAADAEGRSWEWEHAYPQRVTRVGDVVLVAECFEDPDAPSRFAEFIATFDPPTVLALIHRIQELGNRLNTDSQDFEILCLRETERVLRARIQELEQNDRP
jgi:hypothetical protein